MRKELQIIEQIENYILNQMTEVEKALFENEIKESIDLKSQVEFQQNFTAGMKRFELKRNVKKAYKRYQFNKVIKGVLAVVTIATIIGLVAYIYSENFVKKAIMNTEGQVFSEVVIVPENDTLSAAPNQFLPQELFEINTDKDTVIESKEGIVIFIPAAAFETENDKVDFILQEALTPQAIMLSGLNTVTATGEELETGGMFYFDAYAEGKRLELKKELVVDIPANPSKSGMELYDGMENEEGELVWTNPKPFTRPLKSVEITKLDFYPAGYEPKMEAWGYHNKAFKDSLYYSYANDFGGYYNRFTANNPSFTSVMPLEMFMPLAPQEMPASTDMPNNIDEVIDWNFSVDYSGDFATIYMNVAQREGWHIYSQVQPDGAIPLPTSFNYYEDDNFALIGKTKEFGAELSDNEGFPERSFHGNQAKFSQKIKITSKNDFKIRIDYSYMACNTACLPPEFRDIELTILGLNSAKDELLDVCGVNPAAVKTIWNKTFNNTNLGTKAFEERMPWIHESCNTAILELYINNLDLTLAEVDLMAANQLSGKLKNKFLEFSKRGDGKVEISTMAQQNLNAYYQKKRKALQTAIERTNENYFKEQNLLNEQARKEKLAEVDRNRSNKALLSKEELAFNTEKVYRELGMEKPKPRTEKLLQFNTLNAKSNQTRIVSNPSQDITSQAEFYPFAPVNPDRSILRARINRLGWKNVDRIMEVSQRRENAIIKGNGNSASMKYSPLKINVQNASKYNRLYVYLVPKGFNSYVKLKALNGAYHYRLNDALDYKIITIGWNEKGMFHYEEKANKGNTTLQLKKVKPKKWDEIVAKITTQLNDLGAALNYAQFAKKELDRKNEAKAKRSLSLKARPFVFPCDCFDEEIVVYIESEDVIITRSMNETESIVPDPISNPQVEPSFPGGYSAMNLFISENMDLSFLEEQVNGAVYVSCVVGKDGVIKDQKITRGLTPEIDAEALRLVRLMPNWVPGKMGGNTIDVKYTLPIHVVSN